MGRGEQALLVLTQGKIQQGVAERPGSCAARCGSALGQKQRFSVQMLAIRARGAVYGACIASQVFSRTENKSQQGFTLTLQFSAVRMISMTQIKAG